MWAAGDNEARGESGATDQIKDKATTLIEAEPAIVVPEGKFLSKKTSVIHDHEFQAVVEDLVTNPTVVKEESEESEHEAAGERATVVSTA